MNQQQLANRPDHKGIVSFFETRRDSIIEAVKRKTDPDIFISMGIDVFRQNPTLLRCSETSAWNCVMKAANAGINLGGVRPQAYLVPYGNECTLVVSYKGWMDLARRGGALEIHTGVVREGDVFKMPTNPLKADFTHERSTDPDRHLKPVSHVWVAFVLKTGGIVFDVMTAGEAMAHGQRFSKSFKSKDSPWQTSPEAMMLKTVIKRPIARGLVPVDDDAVKLVAVDDQVIDGEVSNVQVIEPPQIEQHPAEEETPPDLDKSWFDKELNTKMSGRDLLAFRNECLETYTNDRQFIFERCEEHDRQIRNGGEADV